MSDTNQFSRAGVQWKYANPQMVRRDIDMMWERRNEFSGVLDQFFAVVNKKDGATHVISSVGSAVPLPIENEDTEPLPIVQAAPGLPTTFTVVSYRSSVRVTANALLMDTSGKIRRTITGPIKAAMRFDEYMRANPFANAFTGTAGADSQPMCANSHPNLNHDTGTWDNLISGALSGPNLQSAVLLMDTMTDEQGDPMDVNSQKVLVHPSEYQTALELTQTLKKPQGMLNDKNVIITMLDVVKSKYMSSSGAFFVTGDLEGEERGLLEVQLMDWNMRSTGKEETDIPIWDRIKGVKTFGLTVTKNIVGSAG